MHDHNRNTAPMTASKLHKLYLCMTRLPGLRVVLIQWLYNKLTEKNKSNHFVFLNYGYHDDSPLPLNKQDEHNRYFIQLYQRAIRDIDLQNRDIVEVGCGQGAGGAFLLTYKNPRSYIGIDLSDKAIRLCRHNSRFANGSWLQGRADALPVADNSIDVVINIESSHCYPSMQRFLAEVWRILRPDGYLAFADLRYVSKLDELDHAIHASGLSVIQRSDITPQVLDSLNRVSDRRKAHINASYSKIWRPALRDISAVENSVTYNNFLNGQQIYLCYLLQKTSDLRETS